jgi:branched-chain amino acid transport system ATP-binding protein
LPLLETRNVTKTFGGLTAVSNLSISVDEGEIRGIIGPNGAGKTTLFNVISGTYRPTSGEVLLNGAKISGLRPSRIAAMGGIRTFQRSALFEDFSVMDNVVIARHLHARESLLGTIFGTARRMERAQIDRSLEILDFVGLLELKDEMSANLSHGHQRALGVAMALATEPRLLMLDEPVAGMNPQETARMTELIRSLRDSRGITVLLVEHDMQTVMGLCELITVINFGEKLAEGTPDAIVSNPEVIEAYLGSEDILGDEEFAA